MMINGIPVVVGEAKTAIRLFVSWLDGVHDIYENTVPQLFVPNILFFATEGKELYSGAIRCPLEFWAPLRLENDEDAIAKRLGFGEAGKELSVFSTLQGCWTKYQVLFERAYAYIKEYY
jgi:type I restriction enzyme R subunit